MRVSTAEASVPGELWVLLVGGGGVVIAVTFLFGTRDRVLRSLAVGLTAALAFVFSPIFALEQPSVGELSVQPIPYVNVLEAWED